MTSLETLLRSPGWQLRPPRLPAADVGYCVHDTPVGPLVLAVDGDGALLSCSYDTEAEVTHRLSRVVSPRVLREARRLGTIRTELDAYFAGTRRGFTVPVNLALATPYARRVLGALRDVPYAQVTSYGEVGASIGQPRAARAVGNALGRNPVCIVVPCHRVLRGGGALGGYAGGTDAKDALLDLERRTAASGG